MTSVAILAVGTVFGLLAAWRSIAKNGQMPVIDPSIEQHWLVRVLDAHPRLAALVARRLNPKSLGGLLLTVSVATIFALSLVAGWVFDTLDNGGGFAQFDEAIAEWGAANATDLSTFTLNLITDLGGTLVVTIVTLGVALYGWWRHRNFHVAWFLIAVVVTQALVNNGLKWLIDRERPSVSQLASWAGSSFPSGHSAAAAATYAGVALVLGLAASPRARAWLAGTAIAVAMAVAATRALLGVHWLTDVIAGLAVGWACFIACAVVFGGRLMTFGEPLASRAQRTSAPTVQAETASP